MNHFRPIALNASINVCQRDDRTLFKDISVCVKNGDFVQIAGANGSGKTTLLKILAGLNQDYKGSLRWQNEEIKANFYDYAQSRVYLGHLSAIKLSLTAFENLRWLASPWGVKTDILLAALKAVKLYGYEDTLCQSLSAGQKRRVALALLLCSPASCWVLDEPFTALDVEGINWLISLMQAHVAKGGAVVVTSHHALSDTPCTQTIRLGA